MINQPSARHRNNPLSKLGFTLVKTGVAITGLALSGVLMIGGAAAASLEKPPSGIEQLLLATASLEEPPLGIEQLLLSKESSSLARTLHKIDQVNLENSEPLTTDEVRSVLHLIKDKKRLSLVENKLLEPLSKLERTYHSLEKDIFSKHSDHPLHKKIQDIVKNAKIKRRGDPNYLYKKMVFFSEDRDIMSHHMIQTFQQIPIEGQTDRTLFDLFAKQKGFERFFKNPSSTFSNEAFRTYWMRAYKKHIISNLEKSLPLTNLPILENYSSFHEMDFFNNFWNEVLLPRLDVVSSDISDHLTLHDMYFELDQLRHEIDDINTEMSHFRNFLDWITT